MSAPSLPTSSSHQINKDLIPEPVSRELRIYAFDPSVAARVDTAGISEITIAVPWEKNLLKGPIGEYLEVIDADPASKTFYKPVDLNDPRLLAQKGLAPSESNPQFHQQMVYAVAMTTIGHFEQALGRVALWSSHKPSAQEEQFVRRLRIYPHALRDRNAFYSPDKKALLFGYFPVSIRDADNVPGTMVFTCLSHDIVAHETTHALLDGVHPRFNEPVNPDVRAFHEAFADIVALFQHFSYPGVLRDQIARSRGNLAAETMLGQLAQQFGRASGRSTALRDALGRKNPETGKWEQLKPDVRALDRTFEPHGRGAILVAAVFGAFLKVYRSRTLDLYRIASEGTGVLREGDIHPDLSNRLAAEAARAARYILQMCIRGIDYCPPVGITFGDYLRGIITADVDLNPEDPDGFRLAILESFRQWGINPKNLCSTSVEGLLWPTGDAAMEESGVILGRDDMKDLLTQERPIDDPDQMPSSRAKMKKKARLAWDLESDRYATWQAIDEQAASLWAWLIKGPGLKLAPAIGIVLDQNAPPTVFRSRASGGMVAVEVHSVRSAVRRTPRGGTVTDFVVEITQRRRGYFDAAKQKEMDKPGQVHPPEELDDFRYRAGCTLLINSASMEVRRVIRTPGTISDNAQLEQMRQYLTGEFDPVNSFDSRVTALHAREPFALLHREREN